MKTAIVCLMALLAFSAISVKADVFNTISDTVGSVVDSINCTVDAGVEFFNSNLVDKCSNIREGEGCPAGCKDILSEFDIACAKKVIDKLPADVKDKVIKGALACDVDINAAAAPKSGASTFSLVAVTIVAAAGVLAF